MNEEGYISIYTTYDKENALSVISGLRSAGKKIIYRTSTESASDDVLYEVCVIEAQLPESHEIIFNLKLSSTGE